jgi:hypothetical protein
MAYMNKYLNNRSFLSVLITALLLFCFIHFVKAARNRAADMPTAAKVLIVSNIARPDDPVILKVAQMLRKEGDYVNLETGTDLAGMRPDEYGAIIVINFVSDNGEDKSIKVFADESAQKKIVLLNAVGDYLAPDNGSARPITVKVEMIASEIVERTNTVLSNK